MDALEDLYENAPCGYASVTPGGTVTRVNETFLAWTGYRAIDIIGRPFESLLTEASQIIYETRYIPVLLLTGTVREMSLTVRRADGRSLPILVSSSTRLAPDGAPMTVRTAIFDATQRRTLEQELLTARRVAETSEARVRVLQQAAATFAECASEQQLARAIADIARTAFRASDTAVMFADDSGALELVAGKNPLDAQLTPATNRPELDAVRTRALVVIGSKEEARELSPGLEDVFSAARIEAVSVVPLRAAGRVLGAVMCFYGRKRVFDEHTRELHGALASQAVQVLERLRLQQELRRNALYDPLTGLANRPLLDDTLVRSLATATRQGDNLVLIFIDLDGFKAVNDELGHAAGDAVMIEIAHRLVGIVRADDTIARFGGDEFVVLGTAIDEHDAHQMAERLRCSVAQPLTGVASAMAVTASVGMALHRPRQGATVTGADLMREADTAMYQSKRAGKDRITTVTMH